MARLPPPPIPPGAWPRARGWSVRPTAGQPLPWPAIIAAIGASIAVPMFTAWLSRTPAADVSKLATRDDLAKIERKVDGLADTCGSAWTAATAAGSQFKGLSAQVEALQKSAKRSAGRTKLAQSGSIATPSPDAGQLSAP